MKRFGQVLGLDPNRIEEYKRYHADIWPEIASAIRIAGITNYSIFLHAGRLFGYYEYTGPEDEFDTRMETLAASPRMREWWDIMESMQIPDPDRPEGDWWTTMEEVFHLD